MKTVFRLVAFALSSSCFIYLFMPHLDPDSSGLLGFWRYLTKWGLTVNVVLTFNALLNEFKPEIRVSDTLLSIALPMNMMILLLYWSLYAIDPALVNSGEPSPWYLEYYLHLGMIVFTWIEGLAFTRPFRNHTRAIIMSSAVACIYVAFVELVVIPYESSYPYPFLGKLSQVELPVFYIGGVFFMMFLYLSSKVISGIVWSDDKRLEQIPNGSQSSGRT